MAAERVVKRVRLDEGQATPTSVERDISPPIRSRKTAASSSLHQPEQQSSRTVDKEPREATCIASPFQLTRIRDLPDEANVDTIGLSDILGDPMIKQCWNFNFLFDIHFIMSVLPLVALDTIKLQFYCSD